MKPKLWVVSFLLMLIITALSYISDFRYFFGISKNAVLVSENPVKTRNQGLGGFNAQFIDADPIHAGRVVITNAAISYVSTNHGETWQRLSGHNLEYIWVDGLLVGTNGSKLSYSSDLGRNWLPLTLENLGDYNSFSLIRDGQGKAWIEHYHDSRMDFYPIHGSGQCIRIGTKQSKKIKKADLRLKIPVLGGELHAGVVNAADGHWAATKRGPFFQSAGSWSWELRSGNLSLAAIAELIVSPINPNVCIARGAGGRLWRTKDRGRQWASIDTGHVSNAAYLRDGTLMIVQSDHRIFLLREEESIDISPPAYFFRDTAKRVIETNVRSDDNGSYNVRPFGTINFKIIAAGGTAKYQWIVAGDGYVNFDRAAVNRPFSETFEAALKEYEEKKSRFVLFVRRPDDGWQSKSVAGLPQYEQAAEAPCRLSVNKNHDLYLDGQTVSMWPYIAVVERAGWIQGGSYYFVLERAGAQVQKVRNCRPTGLARYWDFEAISLGIESRVFEIPDGFEVLTPDSYGGIDAVRVELEQPPPWRWLIQRLSFGPGFVIAWGVLAIWAWLIRRSRALDEAAANKSGPS